MILTTTMRVTMTMKEWTLTNWSRMNCMPCVMSVSWEACLMVGWDRVAYILGCFGELM